MRSWKQLLHDEFRSVASHFTPESKRIWKEGFRWITNHKCGFGVVSWEPFFIGLLNEKEAFAGRALDALINRKRLLNRLNRVIYDSPDTVLHLDDRRRDISFHPE